MVGFFDHACDAHEIILVSQYHLMGEIMRRDFTTALSVMLVVGSIASTRAQDPAVDHSSIALRWAPYIYQDTDSEFGNNVQDYITDIYYDDNIIGNNWENVNSYPLKAYVYYSVIESKTHYFLGYYFYHPRDWGYFKKSGAADKLIDEHEHDLEGVMLVVAKPGMLPADLELMYTQAHKDTYYFFPDNDSTRPSVVNTPSSIDVCIPIPGFPGSTDHLDHLYGNPDCYAAEDSTLYLVGDDRTGYERAAVYIECRGHGVGQIARAMVADNDGPYDWVIRVSCG